MNVTVYSKANCPACRCVKRFLDRKSVPFQEVNIDKEPDSVRQQLLSSGHMSLPVVDINGTQVAGFNPDRIKQLLSVQ